MQEKILARLVITQVSLRLPATVELTFQSDTNDLLDIDVVNIAAGPGL